MTAPTHHLVKAVAQIICCPDGCTRDKEPEDLTKIFPKLACCAPMHRGTALAAIRVVLGYEPTGTMESIGWAGKALLLEQDRHRAINAALLKEGGRMNMSKTWRVYGVVTGDKYLGTVEAETEKKAIEKGWELDTIYVSLCPHCSDEIDDLDIHELQVEDDTT